MRISATILTAAWAAVASARSLRLAPLMIPANGKVIPNEYIVQLSEPEFAITTDDGAYPDLVRGNSISVIILLIHYNYNYNNNTTTLLVAQLT